MKQGLIIVLILAVLTLVIVILKPQMHNEVKIVNTEFAFFNTKEQAKPAVQTNVQPQNAAAKESVKVKTSGQETAKNNIIVKPQAQTVTQSNVLKPVSTTSQQVKSKVSTKNNTSSQKTVTTKPVQTTTQKVTPVKTQQKQTSAAAVPKQTAAPKPTSSPKPAASQTAQKQQEQEAISWNKWRANVHNSIISQVNLPSVPAGTVFSYSFTVSSSGVITNVRTSSTAPQYTAYAIQYIAPVIRRSAHASFLTFPSGTSRTSVNVEYKFRTTNSGTGSQASASNFNDVEIIKK